MGQELSVLRGLPVGIEVGQVGCECLRFRVDGIVVEIAFFASSRDAQQIGIVDCEMRQVVGVREGGDEFKL